MRQLELRFENEDGKTATLSLQNPVEPVDAEQVSAVMDEIIHENVFSSSGGDYVKKKDARITERIVEEIEIV
ncbi:MAG TPA: DUF2922 domain-containing protein [Candidatus Avamphibacillus intestinigallinarum]|nr:DUF2922 domain-containing protein [Candidatus Avamphibacillus intestinigallinarum]